MRAARASSRVGRLLGLVLALIAPAAIAALAPPPLSVSLSPDAVRVGETVSLRLAPAPGARALDGVRVDLHLVRIPATAGVPWAYLDSSGQWSPRPTPFRAGVIVSELAGAEARWREAGPPVETVLGVVLVRPGTDPRNRQGWAAQPILASLGVRGAAGRWTRGLGALWMLGLATAAAIVVVARADGRVRGRAATLP